MSIPHTTRTMIASDRSTLRRLALLLVMIALMGGCGEEIDGTYEDPDGQAKLEFRDRNRVYFTFMGTTVRGEYEIDGDRIIITGNGASHVLTRSDDTIEGFGPLDLKLTRVEPTH